MSTKPIQKQEFKTKEERLAALRVKANATNKSLGLQGMTRASDLLPWKRASFGVKELDDFTGGGLIHGAFVTVWGGPGCGKTTLAYKTVAQAQKEGKICYWIALEPLDVIRAQQFGVNLDELQVGQFPQAEQCLDTIIDLARSKLVDVIILDSIHSMSPKDEQENKGGVKSIADNTMGLLARKLSIFFPQAADPIKRAEIAVMLIGQTRMNIGFISFEKLSGGNALLHNSRLTIRERRGATDDAPKRVTYEETGELDVKGNQKKKKVESVIGFPAVFKLDKVQVSGSKPELSVLSIPYYFESGYDLPQFIKDEEAAVEAASKGSENITLVGEPLDPRKPIPEDVLKAAEIFVSEPQKTRKRGRSAKKLKG
jgi:RecA/RadA recombinase